MHRKPSNTGLVALFSFDWGKLLAEKPPEGSLEICAARQKVGLLDGANRDGFELLFAQFGVEAWDAAGEKAIEILFDIGELAGEDVYSLELVFGWAALPEHEGAVKKIGVLPETLLAGDGAAFLGRPATRFSFNIP